MWDLLIINPMVNTLLLIYNLVAHNFGWAIIVFTILIRLITYPLTLQQMKGSQGLQEMQNSEKWKALQKKYKDDKEKLAQEQMKLYQELGINPFAPCLPTLIQFPVMIGLYQSITRVMATTPLQLLDLSGHLYGWINASELIPVNSHFLWMNLGLPERLYVFGIGLPILTVLVVATTYLQQKLMMPPTVTANDQSAQMNQMMNIYMPLLMGWISYTLPAGLAVYFVAGNFISIAQYAAMGKLNWRNLLPGANKSSSPAKPK